MKPGDEGEYRPFPNRARRNWTQRSIELPVLTMALALPEGGRLLEIGCGRGIGLSYFAERLHPSHLVGLDVDQAVLAEVEASWSGAGPVELICADVRAMPFAAAAFDLVVDFGTLFHIPRPEEAVAEIARVLARGGLFVHETWVAQLISHPHRLLRRGRFEPWAGSTELVARRRAALWTAHERA